MKKIPKWKLNVSITLMIILFIAVILDFLLTTLIDTPSLPFLVGGMIGTLFSVYFAIVIPTRAIFELKQTREK